MESKRDIDKGHRENAGGICNKVVREDLELVYLSDVAEPVADIPVPDLGSPP